MIALTALREKIRKKVFFVVFALGALITLIFSTGAATVTVNGIPVTDYQVLLPMMLTVLHAVGCSMAIVLSLSTIPNEYERRTNQLVLIRGVSQARYHGNLALANVLASLISYAILFSGVVVYIIISRESQELLWVIPSYLFSGISIALVSLLVTWLSVILPKMTAGVIGTIVMLFGIFYSMVDLMRGMAGGFAGKLLKAFLFVIPNLHGIQSASGELITNHSFDLHNMFVGLFYAYLFVLGIILCRRKED